MPVRALRWHRTLVVVAFAACTATVFSQAKTPLASLTVPESQLPSGCRLRPNPPPRQDATQVGATTVVAARPMAAFPYPSNPWSGTDSRLLVQTRKRFDAPPSGGDAPPPSAAELAAMRAQWIEHVVDGYRAVYEDSAHESVVEVAAIRFDDPSLATTSRSASQSVQRLLSGSADGRFVKGDAVVRVDGNSKTDCFRAVDAYVRSVK